MTLLETTMALSLLSELGRCVRSTENYLVLMPSNSDGVLLRLLLPPARCGVWTLKAEQARLISAVLGYHHMPYLTSNRTFTTGKTMTSNARAGAYRVHRSVMRVPESYYVRDVTIVRL
jgi:hypothetical protein